MATKIHLFITSLLFLAIAACGNGTSKDDMDEQLRLADQYLATQPRLSLTILDSISQTHTQTGHYFALLYAQAKYLNYIKQENDSLIQSALQYYATCDNDLMKARAFLAAAQVYRELGEDDTALMHIFHAAETASFLDNDTIKCQIYYTWGRILKDASDIDNSTGKFSLSLIFAKEINDTPSIINRLNEIGYNYLAENHPKAGIAKFNEAIKLATATNSFKDLAVLYGQKSLAYYLQQDYSNALKCIDDALAYNKYLNRQDSLSNINFKGKILMHGGNIDSAKYYIEQSSDTSTIYGTNIYYANMSELSELQHDYRNALKFEKLHSKCLLQIAADIENNKIAELNRRYDMAQAEIRNNQLEIENQQKSIIAMTSIAVAIIVLFATYLYISHHRHKSKLAMQQQLNIFNNSIKQMQQREEEILYAQLKAQEDALTYAHSLEDKVKELYATKELLSSMRKNLLHNNIAVKRIDEILKHSNNPNKVKKTPPLNSKEISEFIAAINNCYDNFAAKLAKQYPTLNINDVYLCCLIKLGLDNPGLCAILDISDNTLRKRKYRLKCEKIDTARRYNSLEDALLHIGSVN